MQPHTPPHVTGVAVVAAQPTEADNQAIAHLSAQARKPLPPVAYLVKVRFDQMPPVTSHGWALYVGDFRIPKYWEYEEGIYFKIFDPQFFADHEGEPLRFSEDGVDFVDTGLTLEAPSATARSKAATKLPSQADALRKTRARRAPARRRKSTAKRSRRR
jgi:hypothetical protein